MRLQWATFGWGESYSWPYGPNIDVTARSRLLDWAEGHGLRRSLRGHPCRVWLRTGAPCRYNCRRPDESKLAPESRLADLDPATVEAPGWMDHVSAWTRAGAPAVVVAQPYQLTESDGPSLKAIQDDPQLRLEIKAPGQSWYGHRTWFVGVWAAA